MVMTIKGSLYNVNFENAGWCYVVGDYCYMTAWSSDSFNIIDVSDPSTPVLISQLIDATDLAACESVVVVGNYAYITAVGNDSITVVDISDPTNPSIVSVLKDSTNLRRVEGLEVSGHYLVINCYDTSGNERITIVDISDPLNLIVTGSVQDATDLDNAIYVIPKGNYAYVSARDSDRFTSVDISDPTNPSIVSSITNVGFDRCSGFDIKGRYAYLCGSTADTLSVIDISDPANMSVVGSVTDATVLDNIYVCQIEGNYVYASARDANNLVVIDVSDPTDPTILSYINDDTLLEGIDDVFIYGGYAYVTCTDARRLTIVELDGIESPVASIGNIQSHRINVSENIICGKNILVHDGITVGQRGIGSIGSITSNEFIKIISSSSYIQLENNTSEDTDGGRESEFRVKGKQSGDEITTLGIIRGSHDEAVDDEKGQWEFFTNDGSDGDTPTLALTLNSAQAVLPAKDIVMSGTVATGLDMSGGTFATAVQNWPADPVIQTGGTDLLVFDETNGNFLVGTGAGASITSATNCFLFGVDAADALTSAGNIFAIGHGALGVITNQTGNFAIGNGTLRLNTAFNNFGVGHRAGFNNTTGSENTYFGTDVGNFNQTGWNNTFIGYRAGRGLAFGNSIQRCTFVGSRAVHHIATGGNDVTAIGAFVAEALTTGKENSLYGSYSGFKLTTADGCNFFGYKSGYNQTTNDDLLIIDNQDRGSAAAEITDCFMYGVFNATPASQSLRLNLGNLYLGNPTHSDADGGGAIIQSFIREDGTGTASTAATITGSHDGVGANDTDGKLVLATNTDGTGLVDRLELDSAGVVKFLNTGGLPFGSVYGNEIGWTQVNAVQNTWYEISDADMVAGQLNAMTHDGNGQLTVLVAGMYYAVWSCSSEVAAANQHIQITFSVNGTEINDAINHYESFGISRQFPVAGNGILDLAANDTVEVSIRTTDAGTPDISVDHLNITLVQIGGT